MTTPKPQVPSPKPMATALIAVNFNNWHVRWFFFTTKKQRTGHFNVRTGCKDPFLDARAYQTKLEKENPGKYIYKIIRN